MECDAQGIVFNGAYMGYLEIAQAEYFRHLASREISIGDYVLTGGELPAMVLMDAVSRFTPGVVGSEENVLEDSITSGLLQHPLYTRPAEYRGLEAPEILRSGNHAEIDLWRRRQALKRTLELRPDLLKSADLTPPDLEYLRSLEYEPWTSDQPDTD